MRALVSWLRLVSGLSVGLGLLMSSVTVATDDTVEPVLHTVMVLLALLGFALLAAGWGLAARWDRPGRVLRGSGLAVFGLGIVAYVVGAFSLPEWLGLTLFAVVATAGLGLPLWLSLGGASRPAPLETDAQGRLEVSVDRAPTVMLAVLAAAMAAASVVMLPIPVLGWVVGTVGVVFFGVAAARLLLLALRPGPAVRADARGMEDRSSLVGVRRISWPETTRVRDRTVFGQPVVAVTPRDWAAVVARQGILSRPLLALNRRLTGSRDLLVSTVALSCSPRDLAERLEEMRRSHG